MVTEFQENVYVLVQQIPEGKVTTYKEIALAMGTEAFRAVGTALKKNPRAPQVPCHRVISSDLTIGGFNGSKSGPDIVRKKQLLAKEGVFFKNGRASRQDVHAFTQANK